MWLFCCLVGKQRRIILFIKSWAIRHPTRPTYFQNRERRNALYSLKADLLMPTDANKATLKHLYEELFNQKKLQETLES